MLPSSTLMLKWNKILALLLIVTTFRDLSVKSSDLFPARPDYLGRDWACFHTHLQRRLGLVGRPLPIARVQGGQQSRISKEMTILTHGSSTIHINRIWVELNLLLKNKQGFNNINKVLSCKA